MIRDMLQKESIQIVEEIPDWKQAIRLSLKPLVDSGYVEERYIDGIIQNTLDFGPYYVITRDVALIHGRPEQGVKKKQLAVTLSRKPVQFCEDEEHQARLLVALAAEDGETHLDVMRTLAELFMSEAKIAELVNAGTAEAIYQIFLEASVTAGEQ